MLIDFHTHVFPEKIAKKAIAKLEDGMARIHGKKLLPHQTDGTLSGLIKSMDTYGVDISVVMPIATTPSQHISINEYARKITDKKRIISFGSMHPRQSDWEKTLEEISQSGLLGIKLHPEFQEFYVDEPVIINIVKKAKALNLLVLFHSGADYGYNPPVHCTPDRLRTLIDKTGGENIIAGHLGGFLMWEDVEKYLVGTPVMMDTSMINNFLDKELLKRIIKAHGTDKFLFGSDSPWQKPIASLEYIKSIGLSPEEIDMITHQNAIKLLNL